MAPEFRLEGFSTIGTEDSFDLCPLPRLIIDVDADALRSTFDVNSEEQHVPLHFTPSSHFAAAPAKSSCFAAVSVTSSQPPWQNFQPPRIHKQPCPSLFPSFEDAESAGDSASMVFEGAMTACSATSQHGTGSWGGFHRTPTTDVGYLHQEDCGVPVTDPQHTALLAASKGEANPLDQHGPQNVTMGPLAAMKDQGDSLDHYGQHDPPFVSMGPLAATNGEAATEDAFDLKRLESKLELITAHRAVSALKCGMFLDYLEAEKRRTVPRGASCPAPASGGPVSWVGPTSTPPHLSAGSSATPPHVLSAARASRAGNTKPPAGPKGYTHRRTESLATASVEPSLCIGGDAEDDDKLAGVLPLEGPTQADAGRPDLVLSPPWAKRGTASKTGYAAFPRSGTVATAGEFAGRRRRSLEESKNGDVGRAVFSRSGTIACSGGKTASCGQAYLSQSASSSDLDFCSSDSAPDSIYCPMGVSRTPRATPPHPRPPRQSPSPRHLRRSPLTAAIGNSSRRHLPRTRVSLDVGSVSARRAVSGLISGRASPNEVNMLEKDLEYYHNPPFNKHRTSPSLRAKPPSRENLSYKGQRASNVEAMFCSSPSVDAANRRSTQSKPNIYFRQEDEYSVDQLYPAEHQWMQSDSAQTEHAKFASECLQYAAENDHFKPSPADAYFSGVFEGSQKRCGDTSYGGVGAVEPTTRFGQMSLMEQQGNAKAGNVSCSSNFMQRQAGRSFLYNEPSDFDQGQHVPVL